MERRRIACGLFGQLSETGIEAITWLKVRVDLMNVDAFQALQYVFLYHTILIAHFVCVCVWLCYIMYLMTTSQIQSHCVHHSKIFHSSVISYASMSI